LVQHLAQVLAALRRSLLVEFSAPVEREEVGQAVRLEEVAEAVAYRDLRDLGDAADVARRSLLWLRLSHAANVICAPADPFPGRLRAAGAGARAGRGGAPTLRTRNASRARSRARASPPCRPRARGSAPRRRASARRAHPAARAPRPGESRPARRGR